MNFVVHMTAFMSRETVRIVEVPDDEIENLPDSGILEKIFHYGQNDFQPQEILPSVSVGDIIKLRQHEYWMVLATGFRKLTLQEFSNINGFTGVKAYMGVFNEKENQQEDAETKSD